MACGLAGATLIAACTTGKPTPRTGNPAPTVPMATTPTPEKSAPAEPAVAAAEITPAAKPTAPTAPTASTPEKPSRNLTRVSWDELPGWQQDNVAEALPALQLSCRVLAKQVAWQAACAAAPNGADEQTARQYFETHFTPLRVSNPDDTLEGLATGYFEPTIRGSRKPSSRNRIPVYGLPGNMLTLDLGDAAPELKNGAPRVRVVGNRVVPYYTRAQIDGAAAPLKGMDIAWVDDEIDLFFLQVQGSGRIQLEEGGVMRIGFAGHNGHPYRSIGRVLIDRGELTLERASMQGIKAWVRANPTRLRELLDQNPRYVFFRELTGPDGAPPGSLGVPLTPRRSVAVDTRYVPLGAPLYIATTWPNSNKPLQQLMLAQDTGGAIRGAVRVDYFWGAGEEAAREAGRMQQSVRTWVLLPLAHPAAK